MTEWRAAKINDTERPWAVIGQGEFGDEIIAGNIRDEQTAILLASARTLLAKVRLRSAWQPISTGAVLNRRGVS